MARAKAHHHPSRDAATGGPLTTAAAAAAPNEEDVGLLAGGAGSDEDDDEDDIPMRQRPGLDTSAGSGGGASQQPQRTPRTPRTPNRVRFDLTPTVASFGANGTAHHHRAGSFDMDDEDPLSSASPSQSRHPLLTDMEAPSVALANSPWGDDEDAHSWAEAERARPKSGLRSAFMNMANSIIGAGIIGQPYAFKQAGLLSGVVLLVVLTVAVDWTICLIVINSKLSGASSFQGTVEHCFGRPGLIAISLAQWVFAFGGMVAFGVIVGDSIPHVLKAVWPSLPDVPVLGLLADRRAVIVVFVLGISYPLTLYRDIAKVSLLYI